MLCFINQINFKFEEQTNLNGCQGTKVGNEDNKYSYKNTIKAIY